MAEKFINARGMQCPGPIVQLFKEAQNCAPGDIYALKLPIMVSKKI